MIASIALVMIGCADESNATDPVTFTEGKISYEVTSDDTVKVIAKMGGYYLGEIVIPATVEHDAVTYNVTAIGEAFRSTMDEVTTVSVPASVLDIDPLAFYGCETLEGITVDTGNPNYRSVSGVLYNKSLSALILYPANGTGSYFSIPAAIKDIGDYAFHDNKNLTSITIPATVQSTGEESFCTALGLRTVIIAGETALGSMSFYKCDNLTRIEISGKATIAPGTEVFRVSEASFFETDGTTEITDQCNLPGFIYILDDEKFVKQFNVFFDKNGGSVDVNSQAVKYNTKITMPAYTGTKDGSTFGGWAYNGNTYAVGATVDKIDGDMTFTAVWESAPVTKYTMTFMNGTETYSTIELEEGADITAPAGSPVKASTSEFDYTFVKWDGLFSGMKATEDQTFYAAFNATLKSIDITQDKVVVDTMGAAETTVPDSMIQQIIAAGEDGKSTEIRMINGAIIIDDVSASALPSGDKAISIYKVQPPTWLMQELFGRPVFTVELGDVHEFDGELTISLKYKLSAFDDPNNVCIWYLTSDETYEKIPATYAEGYVTFTVNHLSTFAITFEQPSGGNNDNTVLIVAIVAVVIVAAGVGAFFYFKKKQ